MRSWKWGRCWLIFGDTVSAYLVSIRILLKIYFFSWPQCLLHFWIIWKEHFCFFVFCIFLIFWHSRLGSKSDIISRWSTLLALVFPDTAEWYCIQMYFIVNNTMHGLYFDWVIVFWIKYNEVPTELYLIPNITMRLNYNECTY